MENSGQGYTQILGLGGPEWYELADDNSPAPSHDTQLYLSMSYTGILSVPQMKVLFPHIHFKHLLKLWLSLEWSISLFPSSTY